ncbi:transposable element Tcb1 transposase [Trichonephila clavipes]|nr:transposable element Tcb1 transposase [Trichonephila clavipes]
MSKYLHLKDFVWSDNNLTEQDILNLSDESDVGYILEVDLECPSNLHDKHSDFENKPPPNCKEPKLLTTLEPKTKYVLYYSTLLATEGTTDRRGRSHPPQCTIPREDRQIVRMAVAVTDHSVTSRTVAQHIESVTHHSVSARTIRHRLQQSGLFARRPLLGLPLAHNHRRLRRQWCDERRMWAAEWNEVVFTDESRICLQHHDSGIRVWRHRGERMLISCVMHRHTDLAPGIMVWVVLDITHALL